ncbi:hypothetical protein FOZ60_012135 [Perkinsus olseni]|uniref:Uncharacterized protein n=1 Tax=Perkinsus olseni TaxID=32597 RepID=A0A7J6NBX2_PEROL|nr:hypothetical protein FOZ60_012135 [Perkinsus olseni]
MESSRWLSKSWSWPRAATISAVFSLLTRARAAGFDDPPAVRVAKFASIRGEVKRMASLLSSPEAQVSRKIIPAIMTQYCVDDERHILPRVVVNTEMLDANALEITCSESRSTGYLLSGDIHQCRKDSTRPADPCFMLVVMLEPLGPAAGRGFKAVEEPCACTEAQPNVCPRTGSSLVEGKASPPDIGLVRSLSAVAISGIHIG